MQMQVIITTDSLCLLSLHIYSGKNKRVQIQFSQAIGAGQTHSYWVILCYIKLSNWQCVIENCHIFKTKLKHHSTFWKTGLNYFVVPKQYFLMCWGIGNFQPHFNVFDCRSDHMVKGKHSLYGWGITVSTKTQSSGRQTLQQFSPLPLGVVGKARGGGCG